MEKKAVCLLSGGLDSCVTAAIAREEQFELFFLSVDYGQRHDVELRCASQIARALGAQDHKILTIDMKDMLNSSLMADSKQRVSQHSFKDIGAAIPSTYVPARNMVFLSLAFAYAESVGASSVFIGVNAVDFSGYPDCCSEFLEAFQTMAILGTKTGVEGHPIHISAPLLQLTKAEIIKKGIELSAPLHHTWSCYQGGAKSCGHCDSCQLRLKGFQEAGVPDPLEYEMYPVWYTP
jgi:7-cyano-7-deazaguanine synthase